MQEEDFRDVVNQRHSSVAVEVYRDHTEFIYFFD